VTKAVVTGVEAGQRPEPSGLCAAAILERDDGDCPDIDFAVKHLACTIHETP